MNRGLIHPMPNGQFYAEIRGCWGGKSQYSDALDTKEDVKKWLRKYSIYKAQTIDMTTLT